MKDIATEDIYMHMANGGQYHPFAPRLEEIDINAIGHMLATRGRWAGATQHKVHPDRIFYSVAEHSIYVADYLARDLKRPDLALTGLLHDAVEAVVGDLIRPLKYSPSFREPFKEIEELNETAFAERLGFEFPFPKEIKIADEAITHTEYVQIVTVDRGKPWSEPWLHDASNQADIEIEMWAPHVAKDRFLATYQKLRKAA